jgi:hypothetical protein
MRSSDATVRTTTVSPTVSRTKVHALMEDPPGEVSAEHAARIIPATAPYPMRRDLGKTRITHF